MMKCIKKILSYNSKYPLKQGTKGSAGLDIISHVNKILPKQSRTIIT